MSSVDYTVDMGAQTYAHTVGGAGWLNTVDGGPTRYELAIEEGCHFDCVPAGETLKQARETAERVRSNGYDGFIGIYEYIGLQRHSLRPNFWVCDDQILIEEA